MTSPTNPLTRSPMTAPLALTVNGDPHSVAAATLADLLAALDYEGRWLATAVNGELVHCEDRAGQRLQDGDRIEILSPRQGG